MQSPFAPDLLEASGLASIKGTVAAHAQNATCLGMPGSGIWNTGENFVKDADDRKNVAALAFVVPDQVDLHEDGREGLARLVTIDGNHAGTKSSFFPVLEDISKIHRLTDSDLKMLGEIADSIAAVTVKSDSGDEHLRVQCALQAIRAVARKACATERSEEDSELLEVHLGPFTCRESAEKSLQIADDLTSSVSPASLSNIIGKFRDMLAVEQVPYTGHSVGFEVEFFSGCSLSTLHPNFGLTATQLANYKQNQRTYDSIFDMHSYMANSAARNIVVQNKLFHRISDEYATRDGKVKYQCKIDGIRDLAILEKQKYKEKKPTGEVKSEFERQVGRLELKPFCLGRGANREMVTLGIEAVWYSLDDAALAETLDKDWKSILAAAAIDMSEVPVIWDLQHENINYDILSAEKWRAIDVWTVDFGYIDTEDNQLKGRQVEYREVINYYLKEFNSCNQVVASRKAVERAKKIKEDHDQDCLIQRTSVPRIMKSQY